MICKNNRDRRSSNITEYILNLPEYISACNFIMEIDIGTTTINNSISQYKIITTPNESKIYIDIIMDNNYKVLNELFKLRKAAIFGIMIFNPDNGEQVGLMEVSFDQFSFSQNYNERSTLANAELILNIKKYFTV